MMKRANKGRGLFYTRDSGGKHEMTPGQYIAWASKQTEILGLQFDGNPSIIEQMIQSGESHRGDVYLDYGEQGNDLERKGLMLLMQRAKTDSSVSHILIPHRDRFARPDNPIDAIQLENRLRQAGITIVYMDRTIAPLARGSRQEIADLISSLIEFDQAGKYRRELARKIIFAQLTLARNGYSTGGRAPYGFCRWLVRQDGTLVRELAEGEYVKMAGHHVVWVPLPVDHPHMVTYRRILDLLMTMPANRVAQLLTAEGVPTPDFGRKRTDNGVSHRTSGVWHASTINNIARNPLGVAIVQHGRRALGDQLRLTPDGPRELRDTDFRSHDDKPKTITNDLADIIRTPARFSPVVDPTAHRELNRILDERGKTQRGKPRSKNPATNPLGGRVFDMHCGWPMYRQPYSKSFRYLCGLYQQSHGEQCGHYHVDGPTATRVCLRYLQQRSAVSPSLREKLRRRLQEIAEQRTAQRSNGDGLAEKQRALADLQGNLETAQQNLALAKTPAQFAAVSSVYDKLLSAQEKLCEEITNIQQMNPGCPSVQDEVEAAMAVLSRLAELVGDQNDMSRISKAFALINVRLFLAFRPHKLKTRVVNRISHGVLTFGDSDPPINIYEGPTARREVKKKLAAMVAADPGKGEFALPDSNVTGREDNSLGNVSRGDRT